MFGEDLYFKLLICDNGLDKILGYVELYNLFM